MKKFKFVFLAVLCFMMLPVLTKAEAKEPINVYVFKSSTCPHCADAMEFFDELSKDEEYSKYFHLIPYETNGKTDEIKANVSLAQKVSKYFGAEFEGVPLIVIGDKKYEGYASSLNDQMKDRIKTCYEKSCTDVVAGIQDGTLGSSDFDTVFLILILVVFVGGIGYFIYIARKNPISEEFNETDELLKDSEAKGEEVASTPKKKKNAAKKK